MFVGRQHEHISRCDACAASRGRARWLHATASPREGERLLVRVIVERAILRVEQPAVPSLHDRVRRRHAEDEQSTLGIPADQQVPKTEVVVEPAAQSVGVGRNRFPAVGSAGELTQLSALGGGSAPSMPARLVPSGSAMMRIKLKTSARFIRNGSR